MSLGLKGCIGAGAFSIMLLPAISLLGASSLMDQGDTLTIDYDITQTDMYQEIYPVYDQYMSTQTEEMIEQAEKIVEENTITEFYTEVKTDPTTGQEFIIQKSREICKVDVYVICNHMDFAYLLAYLSVNNSDIVNAKKYNLNAPEINAFLGVIQEVKIEHAGSNYYIYNDYKSKDEIKLLAAGNNSTDQLYFETTFYNYQDFMQEVMEPENYHFGGAAESYRSDVKLEEDIRLGGMPEWYQYTGAWADYPYGSGTISSSGCAIVCLAMVTSYMQDMVVSPLDIVGYVGNTYYVPSLGSSWDIFPAVANNYGYNCSNLGKNESAVIDALQSGHPVIASMGPGKFTKSGHFIVLKGITSKGKILVNDPNDNKTKKHNQTEFSLNQILSESKNFWSFY